MNEQIPFDDSINKQHYDLILFVAGNEPNSITARVNLTELCEQELNGRCKIEIVDVMEDFASATEHNILLTPTLLIQNPEHPIMVIGNLSNREKLRAALNLTAEG